MMDIVAEAQKSYERQLSILKREDEELRRFDFESFLDFAGIVARWLRKAVADRDSTGCDTAIGFLASDGLMENPVAAFVAKREYENKILSEGNPSTDTMIQWWIDLCCVFDGAWKEAGISIFGVKEI